MSGSNPIETTIDATRKILAAIKEDASVTLEIPSNLNQGNLSKFTAECEAAAQAPKLVIDASDVDEIDDAGLQALREAVKALGKRENPVSFDPPPSDVFLERAAELGIAEDLGLD